MAADNATLMRFTRSMVARASGMTHGEDFYGLVGRSNAVYDDVSRVTISSRVPSTTPSLRVLLSARCFGDNHAWLPDNFDRYYSDMTGNELLKRLRKIARERGLHLDLVRERGKGSHATLYLGHRFTVIKDRKKEIGPGLLRKMLNDLGLDKSDIE
jgi:mRNA interferase HicA